MGNVVRKRLASLLVTAGMISTTVLMGAGDANATVLNHVDAYLYSGSKVSVHTWLDVSWDSGEMTVSNFGDKDDLRDGWGAELIVQDYNSNVVEHLYNNHGSGHIVRSSSSHHVTGGNAKGLILSACRAHSSTVTFDRCRAVFWTNPYN